MSPSADAPTQAARTLAGAAFRPCCEDARTAHYPEMPLRCTRQILPLLAVLAILSAPALAAASGVNIVRLSMEPAANGIATTRIAIEGNAPSGCVPKLERVALDGADVSVELSAPATGCRPARPAAFHILADPAATIGLRALPAGVYRVRVYARAGSNLHLAAFTLVDTSAPTLAPEPESGFWWTQADADNTASAGTGMSIEVQENQLAASVLGFSGTGVPTWYFGSATLTGHVASIPLVQLANGEEWFSAVGVQPDVQSGPRLEIEFLSPTRAHAYLVRKDEDGNVQARSLALSRSAFATGPVGTSWVGRWVLVPEDGSGTRLYDFGAPSSKDAESFRLVDAANDAALDCRLVAGTTQADVCTLSAGSGIVADFDQVGYDRLVGHGVNGGPVQLLRVPR